MCSKKSMVLKADWVTTWQYVLVGLMRSYVQHRKNSTVKTKCELLWWSYGNSSTGLLVPASNMGGDTVQFWGKFFGEHIFPSPDGFRRPPPPSPGFQAFGDSFMMQLISTEIYASFLFVVLKWSYTENLLCFNDGYGVECLRAATNTNCQWKSEHRCLPAHCNLLHYQSIVRGSTFFYVECCPNIGLRAAFTDHVYMCVATYGLGI